VDLCFRRSRARTSPQSARTLDIVILTVIYDELWWRSQTLTTHVNGPRAPIETRALSTRERAARSE
jgi:hypothetical protein